MTPKHWYLVPAAVLAGVVIARHPYDRPPLLERLGAQWSGTRVTVWPVQALVCAVATLCGSAALALLVALMTMLLELMLVAGESGRARGVRFETAQPHPFSAMATRVPRLGFVLDSDRHAVRVVLGYLCALTGPVAAATVAPVSLLAAGALFLMIACVARGRFGVAAGLFVVLVIVGVPAVSTGTAVVFGAAGYGVVRWLHRIPVDRVPVPAPASLRGVRRMIGRGLMSDASRMLDVTNLDRDETAIAVLLLRAYARMKEQRPRSALAELDDLQSGKRTAWLRLDAHQRAVTAVIEVNARLDLLDAPGARLAGEGLIAYRQLSRCHLPLLRECLLAEARLLREDPEAPCGGPAALALVEHLVRALPAHPLTGGTPVCARLIAAAAETAATVDNAAACALMSITFTTAGFGGYGDDRGFSQRYDLDDLAVDGADPPTEDYPISERQLDGVRERELLLLAWWAGQRQVPEFGELSTARSRRMAALLDRYGETFGKVHKGRRTRLSMYGSYFEGLALVDGGDLANGFSALCLSALQNLRARQTLGHPVLARTFEVLATQHFRFGVYDVAADGYWNAYAVRLDGKSREAELTLARLCVAAVRADHREALGFVLAELEGRETEFARCIRALGVLLADHEAVRLGELDAALTGMRSVSALAYAYAVSPVTELLARAGRSAEALDIARRAMTWCTDHEVADWALAEVRMVFAELLLDAPAPDHELVLEIALKAWQAKDDSRYSGCDEELRRAAWRDFGRARRTALAAAVRTGRDDLVAVLIERARVDSEVATSLERQEPRWNATAEYVVDSDIYSDSEAAESRAEYEPIVPPIIFQSLEVSYNATTVHRPGTRDTGHTPTGPRAEPEHAPIPVVDDLRAAVRRAGIDVWLGVHREDDTIYWSMLTADQAASGAVPAGLGTEIDFALTEFDDGVRLRSQDLLATAGSPNELALTGPLAALVPDDVRTVLAARDSSADVPRLALAFSPELAVVPWPILPIAGSGQRLLESCCLRIWCSQGVESRRPPPPEPGAPLPIAICCDDPTGTLQPGQMRAATSAHFALGSTNSGQLQRATRENVAAALTWTRENLPRSLAFFRSHSVQGYDAAHSTLRLAGEDEIVAAELHSRYGTGEPFIPMPARVILSSCSSSSMRGHGGASIGLAAGCLAAGASGVVATGVDVDDVAFTLDLDDELVAYLRSGAEHDRQLRELQLRLLAEWRDGDRQRRWPNEITDSHPLVWSYYWAF
ncbi:CHAT domain-containing protein [Nocardia sp. NPDC058176]|uniref:CHAT domain-containing protein n=1 Tax=Nocardia sp. NPDC058176 TaxID=3346368 RepID=UPI0036DBDF52